MIPLNEFDYVPNSRNASDWQHALEEQLAVIDGVCRKHDLKYFLAFGGLLGAIRHRGMIPWDNDADIVMFEEDYLKLQKLSNEGKLPEGYQLIDRSVEDDYSLLFGRIVKKDTSCPISTAAFNGGTHGLFIDVFILFPVPEEEEAQIDCITDFLVWEEMQCHIKRRSKFRSALFRERWQYARQLELEQGRAAALKYCEEQFRSKMPEHSTKCIHGSGGAYQGYPVLDTAWFDRAVYKQFGAHQFAAPAGYLQFFRRRYGGSWRMLPSGERFQPYSCASLSIPYWAASEDYMQFIDRDQAVSDFDEYKQVQMREMLSQSEREPLYWGMKGKLKAKRLDQKLKDCLSYFEEQITLEKLASAQLDLDAIVAIQQETAEVIDFQIRGKLKAWRLALPCKPALLSAALWAHYVTLPDFWSVEKAISCQRVDKARCIFGATALDQRLERILEATNNLYEAIDQANAERVAASLAVIDSICPSVRHARVGHAYLDLLEAQSNQARCGSVRETVEEWLARYQGDDYLRLFAAELAHMNGDRTAAEAHFAIIAQEGMNGMILLYAQDYCQQHELAFALRDLSRIPEAEPKPKQTYPEFKGKRGWLIKKRAERTGDLSGKTAELKAIRQELEPYREKIDGYRKLRRLTSDRIQVWERLYPRKQALLDAAAAGKWDEARKYGKVFLDSVYRHFDGDRNGLAVDSEITEACLPLMREDRGEEFVQQYLDLIPEPHKESMADMLRRKGVDHPYFHCALKSEKQSS